jgi:hypothetical protein
MREPGPITALLIAAAVAALYSQGGAAQAFAALILLAVLITPVAGQPSLLQGLLGYLNQILTEGIRTGA